MYMLEWRLEKASGEGRGMVAAKGQFQTNLLFSWEVPEFERETALGLGRSTTGRMLA